MIQTRSGRRINRYVKSRQPIRNNAQMFNKDVSRFRTRQIIQSKDLSPLQTMMIRPRRIRQYASSIRVTILSRIVNRQPMRLSKVSQATTRRSQVRMLPIMRRIRAFNYRSITLHNQVRHSSQKVIIHRSSLHQQYQASHNSNRTINR